MLLGCRTRRRWSSWLRRSEEAPQPRLEPRKRLFSRHGSRSVPLRPLAPTHADGRTDGRRLPYGAAVTVDLDDRVELQGRVRVKCTPLGEGYASGYASLTPKLLAVDPDPRGTGTLDALRRAKSRDAARELVGEVCVAAVCKGDHQLELCEELLKWCGDADDVGVLCVSALAFVSSARSKHGGFNVTSTIVLSDRIWQRTRLPLKNSTRDDLASNMSRNRVIPGRDTS